MDRDLDALEARIVELEIRYTQQEATVETLSDVVREQYGLIERLQRSLDLLREKLAAEAEGSALE